MDIKFPSLSFFVTIFLILLGSCSKTVYQGTSNEPVIFPPPPDIARIQFLTRFENSSDIGQGKFKFKNFVVGSDEALQIIKPYGITVNSNRIFICDAGIAGLEIINLQDETFKYFIPKGRGALKVPRNCFIDDKGYLYITDSERNQVVIFDEELVYSGEIGRPDFNPVDVHVHGDTILVADPKNNKIHAYNRTTHDLMYSFPKDANPGEINWLYNPQNIIVRENKIYVTDFGDPRIKIYGDDGQYLSSVGQLGRRLGQFTRPKGIALDRDNNLYVVDAAFENIQIFNRDGSLLMFFGGPYKGPGDMYLPADVFIDYDHLSYFEKYVDPAFALKYLIFVTNQYGSDKVSVYGRVEPKL